MSILKEIFLILILLHPQIGLTENIGSEEPECREVEMLVEGLRLGSRDKEILRSHFEQIIADSSVSAIRRGYCRAVCENLRSKILSVVEGVKFTSDDLIRTTILYEQFRLLTLLSSGVSPKRYFGFLDGRGKTSEYEEMLLSRASDLAPLLNKFLAEKNSTLRVSAKEIIVTFLAEGGSLLLTDEFDSITRIHPVRHVGLDDYQKGFALYPGLISTVDDRFGTKLDYLIITIFGQRILLRPMTFTEAVIATGVMYLYEKEITEQKRLKDHRSSLTTLSPDEQFVHTSLVYNSGILFSDERVSQILTFRTGDYLIDVNRRNARSKPQLRVLRRTDAFERLKKGEKIPRQLTSCNAVYHVTQRYGAWVALDRFGNLFDQSGRVSRSE